MTRLAPVDVLQAALDASTTEERCDRQWVAALAGRVLDADAPTRDRAGSDLTATDVTGFSASGGANDGRL